MLYHLFQIPYRVRRCMTSQRTCQTHRYDNVQTVRQDFQEPLPALQFLQTTQSNESACQFLTDSHHQEMILVQTFHTSIKTVNTLPSSQ